MTNFRDKARAVKAAGVAERGNFAPTGAPKRMYSYWLQHSNSKRAKAVKYGETKENFCHFWRVVAIWAPLMFLVNKAFDMLDHPATWVVGGIMVVVAVVVAAFNFSEFAVILGIVSLIAVGIASIVSGVIAGISLYDHDNDEDRFRNNLPGKRASIALAVFGLPSFALLSLGAGIGKVWDKYNLKRFKTQMLIALAVVAAIGFGISFFITDGLSGLLIYLGLLVALPIAGFGLLMGFFVLSDYLSGLRAEALRKARERPAKPVSYATTTPRKPRQPGFISKFFTGVADFIILIAQVVRVNKWKICPLVEVDADRR